MIHIPCVSLQGFLTREKVAEAQSLDQLTKSRKLPQNQEETFKLGFSEGFMRSQAFTQRTQGRPLTPFAQRMPISYMFVCALFADSLRRTRLVLIVLLLVGIYGLSRAPFLSGKGSFSDAGLSLLLLLNYLTATHKH